MGCEILFGALLRLTHSTSDSCLVWELRQDLSWVLDEIAGSLDGGYRGYNGENFGG